MKAKGKPKGKRGELEVVKTFNDRFNDYLNDHPEAGRFSRSVGSGNRWGQNVTLSQNAQNTFSGDITCPDKFRFVIEAKIGYNDIDLLRFKENNDIEKFLAQVSEDSQRCGREPLLLWKKDHKPRLAIIHSSHLPTLFDYRLYYKNWVVVLLDDLLSLDDAFFFVD